MRKNLTSNNMLTDIYTAIKTQLTTVVTAAKDIQWFNMQYDTTIATDNILLIEFPDPIVFPQESNQQKTGEIRIRIHVVHQILSQHDGSITDSLVTDHDTLAESVRTALSRFRPSGGYCNTLQFTTWQHWHRMKGLMITFVDFSTHKKIV